MEKKRIFYLDLIRVIAMIMIVNYHFFAENHLEVKVLSDGMWGFIGVAMFFMISGASLMYQYHEKLDIKSYFKKRFLGIYPMFWIAYALLFLYLFYVNKGFFKDLPIYKIGLSLLGMDGYLIVYMKTWYLIGEWFIGCIILIYLLFPLFRIAMKKYPRTFFALATIANLAIIFFGNFKMPLNHNLLLCSYSFLLGMYFMEYYKKFELKYAIIAAILAIVLWNTNPTTEIGVVIVGNLMGYGCFITLSYVGEKMTNTLFKNIVLVLSKYSYAIFLTHHFLIMKAHENFAGVVLDKYAVLCLYILTWVLIGIYSKIIYELNRKTLGLLKNSEKGKNI